jgi:hypothetical protein
MSASDDPVRPGDSPRVQLRAAFEGTITDPSGVQQPMGVDRLYLMVTAVFDRLTEPDRPATGRGL